VSPPDLFATEPIVGWRAWWSKITVDGPRLFSYVRSTVWEPGLQFEAECSTWDHEPPGDDCKCGIYAVRDFDQIRLAMRRGMVVGQVALAGQVIEGERGYRAARAWPLKLYIPRIEWCWAKDLASAYGVPVALRGGRTMRT
jgi:hypothetical protein